MELYGGGMVGKSTNYQLGGQIARSRRRRDFQGEMRKLIKKQEAAKRRKKESSFLGSIGSLAGGAIGSLLGPAGTAIGAGLGRRLGEGTYKETDYGNGKYAKETRGELGRAEKDYQRGMAERALVSGLQAAVMPGIYDKAGSFLKGLGGAGEAATTAATTAADITGTVPELAAEFGGAPVYEGMASGGFKLSGPPKIGTPPSMAMEGFGSDIAGKLSTIPSEVSSVMPEFLSDEALSSFSDTLLGDFSNIGLPSQFPSSNNLAAQADYYGPYFNRQGGMIPKMPMGGEVFEENLTPTPPTPPTPPIPLPVPMSGATSGNQTNQYGVNLGALQGLSASGFNMGDFLGGAVLGDGSGVDIGLQGQMDSLTALPPSPQGQASGQYGTAIGSISALNQMGMGDIANDPRLQEYLEDLPQFGMGYQQQFGDIQSGGRQALSQMYAAQRNMGGGFAGAGAGSQAFGQQYGGLMDEQARKRRGVVEGYQADLLSAIGDIEAKGEFEFGEEGLQDRQKIIDFLKQRFPSLSDDKISEMADAAG